MKTSLVYRFLMMGALLLPWVSGCAQQTASNPPMTVITTISPIAYPPTDFAPTTNTPAAVATPPPVVAPLIVIGSTNATATNEVAAAVAPPAEAVVPANLRVTRALGDVIQLAQSGVEESIMLTYVTNSPAAFLLGAEEIVYLKDLGVPSSVITSMMQRDQALRNQWGMTTVAATAANPTNDEPIAIAPTYANQPAPAAEPAPAEVSETYFYDTLSPYGNWVEVDGYGRCWRPTVVAYYPSWRPYCDNGRWVYSDCGWYWASGYSWGSVAFHYGRWFSHPRYGWCWWPNNVWAPSWVSWRYDNSYCGWAPLPPNSIYTPGVGLTYFGASVGVSFGFQLGVGSYTYVPWGRVCDPYPYRHCAPQAQVVAIHGKTTPANHYGPGSNNRVENRGIAPERYQEHARTELRTVKIREEATRGGGPRPERFEGNGRTLVVNRPAAAPRSGENYISQPATVAPSRQANNPRSSNRPTPIIVNGATTRGTPTTSAPERPARSEENGTTRSRGNSATIVERQPERTATPATSPTPVTRPTPIFSKPLVVESTPQLNRPSQPSTTVIGGNKSGTATRDYSVWSSPTPRPTTTPTPNNNSARTPSVGRNSSNVEYTAPSPAPTSTPDVNRSRENNRSQEILAERSQRMERERSSRSQLETRSATPNYSAPSPRPATPTVVINPTPTVNATPRPTYTAPAPAPSTPTPAPSRVESSRPASTPAANPDASRSSRNR
ncbi:MAG: hypothetical protein QM813_27815 [Verrucomicrobiota bacterium]